MPTLTRTFFNCPTLIIARELLGQRLIFREKSGLITETEAYIGEDDPACHAARGRTPRNTIIFGEPGRAYIYLIYGMYFCCNVIIEKAGFPAAVLLCGILGNNGENYNGPGKLCRYLSLTKDQNRLDLTTNSNFTLQTTELKPAFQQTPRIGIRVGTDKFWRFVVEKNEVDTLDH